MTGTLSSPWTAADLSAVGVAMPAGDATATEAGRTLAACARACEQGKSLLAWQELQVATASLDLHLDGAGEALCELHSRRVLDPFTQTAVRLSVILAITQHLAETLLSDALAARDRLPECANCLRDGLISINGFKKIIARTDAVTDETKLAAIDAAVTAGIRRTPAWGAWTPKRLAELTDRTVMTHDPDGVRTREQDAADRTGVWAENIPHGLGELTVVASAEDVTLAKNALDALIGGVCENDPRTKSQRRSAAAIARLRGTVFRCECGHDDCPSALGEHSLAAREAAIVLHAICDSATLAGDAAPGYLDGYGVLSPDHVRRIAARDDTLVRPLDLADLSRPAHGNARKRIPPRSGTPAPSRGDESRPAPRINETSIPSDPYRLTATAEAVIRFFHGTCTLPGCDRPAWSCDLDHVTEFAATGPGQAGPTCLCNVNPKCRFHHLVKTHCDAWADDQYTDADGTPWTSITTPEGVTVAQPARTQWLFPRLRNRVCGHVVAHVDDPGDDPGRRRTRTENKHARRLALRAAARREREAAWGVTGEPPF